MCGGVEMMVAEMHKHSRDSRSMIDWGVHVENNEGCTYRAVPLDMAGHLPHCRQ